MVSLYIVYIFFLITNIYCKPNIVLVLSDDQDLLLNGMLPMKNVINNIANDGITCTNAFVNSPICCPSRSSLLTGRYPHNTGVWNNSISGGCASSSWHQTQEPFSVANILKHAGYETFYAGKYLNQYGTKTLKNRNYVPKGWCHWYGLIGNSKYYNYSLSENGKLVKYTDSYLTDVIRDKALDFLKINSSSFFMVLAVPAPHAPATAAARHHNSFPNTKAVHTPSYNTVPVGKHWLLRQKPTPLPAGSDVVLDAVQRRRLQSLLAVDELVGAVINELKINSQLNNTYILYTSDNGYHIGQFSQPWDKRQPYDTDIRVPLLIRGPNLPAKKISSVPIQTVDLAPTLLDMAGLEPLSTMDGRSVLPDLQEKQMFKKKETNILIEYQGEGNAHSNDENCSSKNDNSLAECGWNSWCKCQDSRNNTYNCVRQLSLEEDFLFCRFDDSEHFVEAYDLKYDKYQLNNIYNQMKKEKIVKFIHLLNKMTKCQGSGCQL